MSSFEVLLE